MKRTHFLKFAIFTFSIFYFSLSSYSQLVENNDSILIQASPNYKKNSFYKKLFGQHYRTEWSTFTKFKIVSLDTLEGGLTPYQAGGGRQSKSLRLRDKDGREYVLRSIDKTFGKALPEIAQGTFIENIIDDQVTIGHPYSAITISPLAEAAGILHTNPEIIYIPKQNKLGEFNNDFGDKLYLFEQRPDENWETSENFGNAKNIVGSAKLYERYLEDADNRVDQPLYLRSRLFDMLIGDWGRHDDQWRWAEYKENGTRSFKPIPRDRDQAYTKFDGLLLKILIPAAGAKHLQTFDYKIKDLYSYNFTAKNMDHIFLNELTLEQWLGIANDLKKRLTDNVIDEAIKKLPPEVYNMSGPDIAAKLKSRRDLLPEYAAKYFKQINKEVTIAGSEKSELFSINRLNDSLTEVSIYKIRKGLNTDSIPLYYRLFKNYQTKEIRIFGIGGNDKYLLTGKQKKGIKIRMIGGNMQDHYEDKSSVKKIGKQTKIYDNKDNEFVTNKETDIKLYSDSSIPKFTWEQYDYNKSKIHPIIFYDNDDRIYVGAAWKRTGYQWMKQPFGSMEYLDIKYSLSQKAFSSTYKATFTDLIGKTNLVLYANYDQIRWTNFYGIGNNTPSYKDSSGDFNLLRTEEFLVSAGFEYKRNHRHRISVIPFFQTVTVKDDVDNLAAKIYKPGDNKFLNTKKYGGISLQYLYQNVNDSSLPEKGFYFFIYGNGIQNLAESKDLLKFGAETKFFIPIIKNISLSTKIGANSLNGEPEFFQYNSIGGGSTLRGYHRERFHGKSSVYNQNDLRWIKDIRSHLFNGKFGIFGLFDLGRVWVENDNSNTWHNAYGAGIMVSPFNKITGTAAIGFSPEGFNIHLGVISPL